MKNKRSLVVLGILLAAVSLVIAQPITRAEPQANYQIQRFVVTGGGVSQSASFQAISVMGQPSTDLVASASYRMSGGFLREDMGAQFDHNLWLPSLRK